MKKAKVKHDGFDWVPPHELIKFPLRKPDDRKPIFRTVRKSAEEGKGSELFLVNHSGTSVKIIKVFNTSFITVDDNTYFSTDDEGIIYYDIPDGSAVKIDHFDDYYDLDYVIGFVVELESEALGKYRFNCFGEKGGVKDMVILWETGETDRKINLQKLE